MENFPNNLFEKIQGSRGLYHPIGFQNSQLDNCLIKKCLLFMVIHIYSIFWKVS